MSEPQREVREIGTVGEWLEWRRHDITASRIAALFDAHPYMTREGIAAALRAESGNGIPSPALRRGRILEPAVAAALAEDHPDWRLAKATTYHRLTDHRLGCTPDYWLDDDGLVQVKTVAPQEWEKWQGRPPLAYTLQTLTELLVTGRQRGVLAIMVCSSSFPVHEFPVPRHPEAEAKILAAVAEWWRAWEAGEIAGAAPAAEIAAAVDDGTHIDLSGDNALPGLLAERAELKAVASGAEKRLAEIDGEIKARIGTARTAWLPGWSISYAAQHRNEFVVPAKDTRVLRVKPNQEISP